MALLTCIVQLGSSRICAAAAWRDELGQYQACAIESEPSLGCVRHGCVVSVPDAATRIKLLMQKLNNRLRSNSLSDAVCVDRVYVGLSGISLHSLPHSPSTILADGTTVTSEVQERLRSESLSTPLEGHDVLDVEVTGYMLDNVPTLNPAGRMGRSLTAHHLLIVADQRLRTGAVAAVERAGFKVAGCIVSDVAEASILTPDEKQRGCVLVDIGAATTTVSVYQGGVLRHLVCIPLGGDTVTRDLMSKGLRYDEAELQKTQWADASCEACDTAEGQVSHLRKLPLGELNSVVMCRYEEILANVSHQIELSGCDPFSLEAGCILTGGASLQKGLITLASRRLGIQRVVARAFTEFGINQSERKPYYTALMSMLKACTDDCRAMAVGVRPVVAAGLTDRQDTGAGQPRAVAAPTEQVPTPPDPDPVEPDAVQPQKPTRKRNRFTAFIGDLFSGQEDDN